MLKQKKPEENLHLTVAPAIANRNRSGVVELVGREPLMFARVENGVKKKCAEKQKKC